MWRRLLVVLVMGGVGGGCTDKAAADYAQCVQSDSAGDLSGAWTACQSAVQADPNSTSGKAAAAKLVDLRPRLDKQNADLAAQAQAAQQAQIQRQAEANRQALAAARLKVVSKPWPKSGPMADMGDQCRTKGKPPILKNYEGDQDLKVSDQIAFAQAELVALADGCVHLFDTADPSTKEHAAVEYMRKSMFCCPK
jgi:hypothetical protein